MHAPFISWPSRRRLALCISVSLLGVMTSMQIHAASTAAAGSQQPDPLAWLEEVEGTRALEWVHAQNERSLKQLMSDPRYQRYYDAALAIAQDKNRIPASTIFDGWLYDGWVYNLWQDEAHPRGLWRRTQLDSYRTPEPEWQTLLDVDALAKAEGKSWVFRLPECLPPQVRRCLIALSDGGKDEVAWREFDTESRSFVKHGFLLPEGMGPPPVWKDEDTLLVATQPKSGAHATILEWSRGQPLSAAKVAFRSAAENAIVVPQAFSGQEGERVLIAGEYLQRKATYWLLGAKGRRVQLILPSRAASFTLHRGEWIFSLREDWTIGGQTWKAGTLLSIPDAESTKATPTVRLMMAPGPREMIHSVAANTRDGVLVITYANARGRLLRFTLENGRWTHQQVPLPDNGSVNAGMSEAVSGMAFVSYEGFLQPTTLYEVDVARLRAVPVKSLPAQFDGSRYLSEQFEATSKDGVHVPYFIVRPKQIESNGEAPTLMHGYGASGAPEYPRYSGTLGRLWLDQGGVYVLANIRGGGEFGPDWHVVRTQRQHTYDDFIAIAEDLIRRRITSPRHLGIQGASSGGLLMGVALTQRPDLFKATVLQVPVLDLLRYDLLRGDAEGIAQEFGSPSVRQELAFLQRTSPFQNLRKRDDFPMPFLITSTKDDNVHPAQARRFAAKMESLGLPYLYYESAEGGHSLAAIPNERAKLEALVFAYLARQLM